MQATKPRLLIVDDEPETIRGLTLGLRSRGYAVEAAGSAAEAIGLLGDPRRFDLVVTDYSMPGINGVDFLEVVRAACGSLPVILMTAYGSKDVLVEALRKRCDGFLEKPFSINELVVEIERVRRLNVPPPARTCGVAELMPMLVHQLNTPLNIIMNSAELGMTQVADADRVRARLKGILDASRKIQRLNQEILGLGKGLEGGREVFDAGTLLKACVDSFASWADLRGIALEPHLDDGEMLVSGNRFALEQAFNNLISNGLEAMADRRGTFSVRLARDFVKGSVVIDFVDQGCGMPPRVAERIFHPYYTTKANGTGLGLAVVQRVVRAHQGEIFVDSAVGAGTRFTVSLPAAGHDGCAALAVPGAAAL